MNETDSLNSKFKRYEKKRFIKERLNFLKSKFPFLSNSFLHRKAEKCWNLINEESSKNINFPQTKVNLEKIKKLIAKKTLNEDKKLKDTFKKAKLKIVNNQNKNIDLLNFDSNDSTNCEMIFEKDKNDQNKHLKQSQVQIEVIVNDKYAGNFEINAHGKECIG